MADTERQDADTVRWNGCTCTVFDSTHTLAPRVLRNEDCPRHGQERTDES